MRRIRGKLTAAILAVCLLSGASIPAFATAQSIVINGVEQEIPAEMGEIIEESDRTFVPLRFVSEAMNKVVKYDDNIKGAFVLDGKDMYIIQEGKYFITKITDFVGTTTTQMDVAAFTKQYEVNGELGGRMYIPIRFMAEAFGYTVGWDEATETVTIDEAPAAE